MRAAEEKPIEMETKVIGAGEICYMEGEPWKEIAELRTKLAAAEERAERAAKASTVYAEDCESLREQLEDANMKVESLVAMVDNAVAAKKVAWDRMAVHNKDADYAVARAETGLENCKKWANKLLDDLQECEARAVPPERFHELLEAEAECAKLREALEKCTRDSLEPDKRKP